jgi:hypothetical protein
LSNSKRFFFKRNIILRIEARNKERRERGGGGEKEAGGERETEGKERERRGTEKG